MVTIATLFLIPVGLLQAATFTFDFESLTLAVGAGKGSIQTYINGVLGAACSVIVSDSNGIVLVDTYYNGDGHVVNGASGGGTCAGGGGSTGVNTSTTACAPTLGYDPSKPTAQRPDKYLKISSTGSAAASFNFAFTLPNIVIDSITLDYEIFPDGMCPALTNCGSYNSSTGYYANQPDMTVTTNLGQVFHDYGVAPP